MAAQSIASNITEVNISFPPVVLFVCYNYVPEFVKILMPYSSVVLTVSAFSSFTALLNALASVSHVARVAKESE